MKKIAFTQRLIEAEAYRETRDALDVQWAKFCCDLGVLPVLLPTEYDFTRYFEEFEIAGIVFTGGNDLSSLNQSPLSKRRDAFETSLLDYAISHTIPVLGVCRGMQFIAAYFGASLQTIPSHASTRHGITVHEGCRYYNCYAGHEEINSYHCFRVTSLPDSLRTVATSDDGTIEALQHIELPIEAHMWHPEREMPFIPSDIMLAQQLFKL